jgi:methylmalonyl-CoA mutase
VRRRAGGRRIYGPDELERLRFISRLKALGLSLAEIKELNAVYGIGGSTRAMLARLDELLARHRADVEARIAELEGLARRDRRLSRPRRTPDRARERERLAEEALMSPAAPVVELHPLREADRVRVVTAASLFDGHDAAINIMRRLLQAQGAEVIHLGHDRSVEEIATAAIQEDARAVAVSSYQGGHMEFFTYLVERLTELGGAHIRVYGGGGGTITSEEAHALEERGVARIFGPAEGRSLGLEGMIRSLLDECRALPPRRLPELSALSPEAPNAVAQWITHLESAGEDDSATAGWRAALAARRTRAAAPVIGFTGTGGAGKSSVVDELVLRLRRERPDASVALLLVDPTRRRTGGALLGDRIRMNAIHGPRIFVRSLATRRAHLALSRTVGDALTVLQAADYDLVIVETAGIGQSDSEVVDLVDTSVYVMTPEYGAPSQLEKIDMLDLADFVVLNKSDRQGALDALRDVRKQWRRNRAQLAIADDDVPVFPTIARQWNDPGVDRLFAALAPRLGLATKTAIARAPEIDRSSALIPPARNRYLAEIAETVRSWHAETERLAERAADAAALDRAQAALAPESAAAGPLRDARDAALAELGPELAAELHAWPDVRARYAADTQSYEVRGRAIDVANHVETLSHTRLPKVALPRTRDWAELTRFLRRENVPGEFPFTAGVFPFKRGDEDPTRMFAGEGTPERTNRRFHLVSRGTPAARLSTAFDSVTLYGRDPGERPDIFGKVGNSGVSVCTVDDAKKLYSGFDLGAPTTSVSMTINGPAPTVLAFFLNAAIDQGVEQHLRESGRLDAVRAELASRDLPRYAGPLPPGHDGLGLALLGVSGDEVVDAETYARVRGDVLRRVRGTVQADILKEDQAQNTCIFSTDFSLKVMGDVQQYFIDHADRELLLGVDLGLPHRRGRGEPDQPARVHARQRLHLLRVLPRARDGDRRLRAELLVLLQQRTRRRVQRDRSRCAPDLGDRAARALRRERAQPEAQVSHPNLGSLAARAGDGVQRHPHDAAGAHGARGSVQQPAHERLRRGGDHTHRGERPARGGDPADHQPRARDRAQRESAPGRLRDRGAHRPSRGGGARRVRAARRSAAVCWAPWRRSTSAAASRKRASITSRRRTRARFRSSASTRSRTRIPMSRRAHAS